jgi:hypothetical protein
MTYINVKTNQGIKRAKVLKENPKTRVVMLEDGNIIKRHKIKHAAE